MSRSYKHVHTTSSTEPSIWKKIRNKKIRRYSSLELPLGRTFHKKLTHSSRKPRIWLGSSYDSFIIFLNKIYPTPIKLEKSDYRYYRHHFVNK